MSLALALPCFAPLGHSEGRLPVKRSSYGERDYAFGQRMLTLRTALGLTQAGLADLLGVSRQAVGDWEAGSSYPKAEHLQHLIRLAVQQQAFPPGREAEEIRALWKAAHQKVFLDEQWLSTSLGSARPSLALVTPLPVTPVPEKPSAPARAASGPRVEWGEALDMPSFYDREQELAVLMRWIVEEDCRMVSVLGMGGIGKSALVVRAMQRLVDHFDVLVFRSLRDAPACSALLEDCLAVLSPEPLPQSLERRLSLLLEELRSQRVLLVLDNLEVLLEEGDVLGRLRPGFEAYGHLLWQVTQTGHQSCLLLTSREKPAALRALESSRSPVRSLPLSGLGAGACAQLLAEHEVTGSTEERAHLGEVYAGNPLALNIVAETIVDLFGGQIDPFLAGGTVIFGSITELLEEQWARLSPLEQTVLCWLAILRGHLRGLDLSQLALRGVYLQGVELQDATLSGVLLRESVLTEAFDAIWTVAISKSGQYWATGSKRGEVRVWREAGQTLHLAWQAHTDIVMSIAFSPDERTLASGSLDGSVKLWDVESGAPLWTVGPINGLLSLAFAPDGRTLASGGNETTIRLWDAKLGTALADLPHPGAVFSLAWSPDGCLLASGGFDGHIRLWQRQPTGPALCVQTLSRHSNLVRGLAFAPDGSRLASASWDGSVKLWEIESGRCVQTLVGHTARVQALAWSPDGGTLASGGSDHTIWLWDAHQGNARAALQGHTADVYGLTFTPDSRHLLSGSDDGTLRLWEVERGESLRVLQGYAAALYDVDWSPDGTQLASAGWDTVVSLWEVAGRGGGTPPRLLRGHRMTVYGVAWRPDGSLLASSGWDNAIRLWDPATGSCVQVIRDLDHPETLFFSVAWSPDGTRLVGGGEDGNVYVWDAHSGQRVRSLGGHPGVVSVVTWAPSGERLISGGSDGRLRWWEVESGQCVRVQQAHQGTVQALKVSPEGSRLASCGDDGAINIWDLERGEHLRTLRRDRPYERLEITGIRGLTEAQKATLRALGAIEDAAVDSP
jgi:WD40 repeat protein/transcriptional regulator with XRE-family HTH domain